MKTANDVKPGEVVRVVTVSPSEAKPLVVTRIMKDAFGKPLLVLAYYAAGGGHGVPAGIWPLGLVRRWLPEVDGSLPSQDQPRARWMP